MDKFAIAYDIIWSISSPREPFIPSVPNAKPQSSPGTSHCLGHCSHGLVLTDDATVEHLPRSCLKELSGEKRRDTWIKTIQNDSKRYRIVLNWVDQTFWTILNHLVRSIWGFKSLQSPAPRFLPVSPGFILPLMSLTVLLRQPKEEFMAPWPSSRTSWFKSVAYLSKTIYAGAPSSGVKYFKVFKGHTFWTSINSCHLLLCKFAWNGNPQYK